MDIEIAEFYPREYSPESEILIGTLRIRIADLGLEILGCHVSKKKDTWFFSLPNRRGVCHKTGKPIHYPIFSFVNRNMNEDLLDALRDQGKSFIEHWIEDSGQSFLSQLKERQAVELRPALTKPKIQAMAADQKSKVPAEKPKAKVFVTPPPLKKPMRSSSKYERQ
jgi:hypothetical protein